MDGSSAIVKTVLGGSVVIGVLMFLAYNTQVDIRPAVAETGPISMAAESVAPAIEVGPTGMAIPVAGVSVAALIDTYKDARAGGARVHDAIDIMAPSGTPVVSATPGRVEKLFFSKGGGGISAYVRSLDGKWSYYYSHLQEYAPGLVEGQAIRRGDPIGKVGFTGNANPTGPHLHFAVNRMAAGEKWHGGRPINPYPLLAGAGGRTEPAGD